MLIYFEGGPWDSQVKVMDKLPGPDQRTVKVYTPPGPFMGYRKEDDYLSFDKNITTYEYAVKSCYRSSPSEKIVHVKMEARQLYVH